MGSNGYLNHEVVVLLSFIKRIKDTGINEKGKMAFVHLKGSQTYN